MKLLVMILSLSVLSLPAFAVGTDKVAHFGLAFTGQTVCAEIAEKISKNKFWSETGCFAAINAAGVAKELTDESRGGKKEVKDIVANVLGSGLSIGVRINW